MPLFVLRNWQAIAGAVVAAILLTLLLIRTDQRNDAREGWDAEKAASALFAERVRSTAEQIQRKAAENARRVEASQSTITQEVSRDYQNRIADLRRRADALRVQLAANRADTRRSGNAVPGLPGPARGPDAAAREDGLPLADAIIATEQAIRLDELQRWVRRQTEVSR